VIAVVLGAVNAALLAMLWRYRYDPTIGDTRPDDPT
jgi:hypothetical protein